MARGSEKGGQKSPLESLLVEPHEAAEEEEMNLEPIEFDPSEALTHFHDPEHQLYGLPERIYFYLVVTSHSVEAFATPVFTIEAVLSPKDNAVIGCAVKFIIKSRAFLIDTGTRVRLWAASADEPDYDDRYLVYDADSSDPKSWEGLLVEIGRVEKFGVLINHADKLRRMRSEWLVEQKRREDERGW
jgi:hypothetical protein